MTRKRLPIGIQTFRNIREDDCYYVDKPADLDIAGAFGELIRQARAHHGERVVVLVDEYDKPILDNLTRPDIAREMRDGLRNLYFGITGPARRSTPPSACSCCSISASSAPGGSRPRRRHS